MDGQLLAKLSSIDDKVEAAYALDQARDPVGASSTWLEAWRDVLEIMESTGTPTIREFDSRFNPTHFLSNWSQDLESALSNAGLEDPRFYRERIAMCEEALRRLDPTDSLTAENHRRAIAESYFELGDKEKAESMFQTWLQADPQWGWGWIAWSDFFRFATAPPDWNRCEQLLRQGLASPDVRDRADILERLSDACLGQGRTEEAARLSEESIRVRRERPKDFETSEAITPEDREKIAAMVSRMKPKTIRREQPKVGRNDPCPCGSGKKYKKCCGG